MYAVGEAEVRAAKKAILSRKYFRYGGHEVVAFEKEWAQQTQQKTCIAVTSGTAALICGLSAMGIGPGDEVLVPAYTFVSTALAVTSVGAIPIYVEIDESLTMDPLDLEKKLSAHSRCVIPVHMQGMPCNLKDILKIAKRNNLLVLEDCCQAAGGEYRGKKLGQWGQIGTFSFNQFKIISCGEGGAVVTSNKKYAERAFMIQDGSCSVWPQTGAMSEAFFCAGNFRFNEINAAILRAQLKRLPGIVKQLRKNRNLILSQIEQAEHTQIIPSHDEKGQCGVCFLIQAESEEIAKVIENNLQPLMSQIAVHRPINSGRHVYAAWDVVNAKIGGHHPDWDCFRHSKNKRIKTNYNLPLKRSNDLLSRTILCHTPYAASAKQLNTLVKKINKALHV